MFTSLFGQFLITLMRTAAGFICKQTKSHVFMQIRVQLFDPYHSFYICTNEADYPGKINTAYLYYCIICTLFMHDRCWSLIAVWEMYIYVWLKPSALCGSIAVADLSVHFPKPSQDLAASLHNTKFELISFQTDLVDGPDDSQNHLYTLTL